MGFFVEIEGECFSPNSIPTLDKAWHEAARLAACAIRHGSSARDIIIWKETRSGEIVEYERHLVADFGRLGVPEEGDS